MAFQKAIKHDAKLRLAICGPAGGGKTFTGLQLAKHLGKKVGVIDTEHGSASKYAHTATCGGSDNCQLPDHFDFDVDEPSEFNPRTLMDSIDYLVANGYDVALIDSLSHYWMGPGGELEMVDTAAARSKSGNSFTAWKTVTPVHNALIDKILSAPIHVIVTMRTKTEWTIEEVNGKKVPRKIGLAPIMRDGIEFEFDVCGDMDQDNNFTVTKSRCSQLAGKVINKPGKSTAETLRGWLGSGDNPKPAPVVNKPAEPSGRVKDWWSRSGTQQDGSWPAILDEISSTLWELAGQEGRDLLTNWTEQYKKHGGVCSKESFFKRTLVEADKMIEALNNPAKAKEEVAA
jgi:hypothetical protein